MRQRAISAAIVGEVTGPVSSATPLPPDCRHAAICGSIAPLKADQEAGRPRCCTAWLRNGS